MEYPSDFDPASSMGIGSPAGRYQFAVVPGTLRPQLRGIRMLITQDRADLGRQLGEQQRCDLTVGDLGEGELRRQGNPEAAEGHGQVQLPAVPPPMPAECK